MKIKTLVLATSLALVPATVALAQDAKKEALKKAKEEAKKKAIEAAEKKNEKKVEAAKAKAEAKADAKAAEAEEKAKAAEAEKQTHAKHLGAIERLKQIADATANADLQKAVTALAEKEAKRHALATEG